MPETEQDILNKIPDNWADDISQSELNLQGEQIFRMAIAEMAKESGINPIEPPEKILAAVLKGIDKNINEALAELRDVSIETAKARIFEQRCGHLFQKDAEGQLSFSVPMWVKITGEKGEEKKVQSAPSTTREEMNTEPEQNNEKFANAIQDAYFKWAKTMPLFPWQKKRKRSAEINA